MVVVVIGWLCSCCVVCWLSVACFCLCWCVVCKVFVVVSFDYTSVFVYIMMGGCCGVSRLVSWCPKDGVACDVFCVVCGCCSVCVRLVVCCVCVM